MPHYHFHLRTPSGRLDDQDGLDLADTAAVRREAINGVRAIISGEARGGRLDLDRSFEIVDAKGQRVLTLPFGDAFDAGLSEASPPAQAGGTRETHDASRTSGPSEELAQAVGELTRKASRARADGHLAVDRSFALINASLELLRRPYYPGSYDNVIVRALRRW